MAEIFDIEELFITVRDKHLRAYNRLVFVTNNYRDMVQLLQLYMETLQDIDAKALDEIEEIRDMVVESGRIPIQKMLKYRINPYY